MSKIGKGIKVKIHKIPFLPLLKPNKGKKGNSFISFLYPNTSKEANFP